MMRNEIEGRKLRIKSNSSRDDKHVGHLKIEREIFRRKETNSFIGSRKILAREILQAEAIQLPDRQKRLPLIARPASLITTFLDDFEFDVGYASRFNLVCKQDYVLFLQHYLLSRSDNMIQRSIFRFDRVKISIGRIRKNFSFISVHCISQSNYI